ncbi:MAG: hypothetical protein LBI05_05755, partial [Planctomycetaceae bacterium]|nr:hypothetical protein [Planctomycetaceae bacterium]
MRRAGLSRQGRPFARPAFGRGKRGGFFTVWFRFRVTQMVTLAMSERKREIFKKIFFENLSFPFRHSQRYHLRYAKSKPNSKKNSLFATTKGRSG